MNDVSVAERPADAPREHRRSLSGWLDKPLASFHLVVALLLLMLAFGLTMVLSSSAATAFTDKESGSAFAVFGSQAMYAGVGLIAFVVLMRLPIGLLRRISTPLIIIAIALLVVVLIPHVGMRINGAQSWLPLPMGLSFQPSEAAKIALLLWSAHVLASNRSPKRRWRALLLPVVPVAGVMALLIMGQPDLGTTVTLGVVLLAVLYFAGAPLWAFAGLIAAGVGVVWWLANSAGYRVERITAWLHPELAADDSTYQSFQGLYGLGSGGVFGVGIGQSKMKWGRLPMADSDFIFAIIGEELGLIGALTVILLFALLAYVGLRIARRNVDPFIKICAAAGATWLVGQAAINIGYVVRLLPVTGLPLPMFSRGGTSLIVTIAVFGLLANFARREPQAVAALAGGHRRGIAAFLGIGVGRTDASPSRRSRRAEAKAAKRAERVRRQRAERIQPAASLSVTGAVARPATSPLPRQNAASRSGPRPGTSGRRPSRAVGAARRHPIRRALGFPVPGERTREPVAPGRAVRRP